MKEFSIIIIALFTLHSCKGDVEPEFDREAMLTSMASGLILPDYAQMESELGTLETSASNFTTSPDASNLAILRTSFLDAYKTFQHIKLYDFGPASDFGIKAAMNTYPTDTTKINMNISSGTYTLGAAANIDAIGFPAVDYLLFFGDDTQVIDRFTSAPDAASAKIYLNALIQKMKDEFKPVNDQWKASYQTTFIAANGTDVGSSLSLMFNEFVKDLELLKNAKIGIPSGQFSGGMPLPEFVEAIYSGHSKVLALESISALKTFFNGGTEIGLDDYMDFIEESQDLAVNAAAINTQFDVSISKMSALGDSFSSDIPTNFTGFTEAFQEIKKLVAQTKTDIPAALGVLITFSDTDGD